MTHEPECFGTQNIHYSSSDCPICSILRAAYKRGLNNAGEVAADLLQAFQEQRITDSEFIQAIKSGGIFATRGGEQE